MWELWVGNDAMLSVGRAVANWAVSCSPAAWAVMTPTHQHQHQPPDLSRPRPGDSYIAASFTFLTPSDPNSVSGVHDETQVASVEIYSSDEEKIFTNLLQNI